MPTISRFVYVEVEEVPSPVIKCKISSLPQYTIQGRVKIVRILKIIKFNDFSF